MVEIEILILDFTSYFRLSSEVKVPSASQPACLIFYLISSQRLPLLQLPIRMKVASPIGAHLVLWQLSRLLRLPSIKSRHKRTSPSRRQQRRRLLRRNPTEATLNATRKARLSKNWPLPHPCSENISPKVATARSLNSPVILVFLLRMVILISRHRQDMDGVPILPRLHHRLI